MALGQLRIDGWPLRRRSSHAIARLPAPASTVTSASCSADGLTGLVSTASSDGCAVLAHRPPTRRGRASAVPRQRPPGSRRPGRAPSISGMNRSSSATSNCSPAADPVQRLVRRGRVACLHRPARELRREDAPVGGVVVDDQRPPAGRGRPGAGPRDRDRPTPVPRASRTARWNVAPSPGTPALSARERAVHRLGEAPADGEAEAGAAVPARDRRVRLAERLEQPAHLVGGDADAGVADVDVDLPRSTSFRRPAPVAAPTRDDDLALLGELDGVRQQVEEDLAEPAQVADTAGGSSPPTS